MKVNAVYRVSVSVIVLDLALGTHIEQFDLLVLRARSKTGAVRVELCIVNDSKVFVILSNHRFEFSVPHEHSLVVATRSDQSGVR